MSDSNCNAILEEVKPKFIASLAERLSVLDQQCAVAEHNGWQQDAYQKVFMITHQLAGTSKIFGYLELASAAESGVQVLRESLDSPTIASQQNDEVSAALQKIRKILRAIVDNS